MPGSDAGHAAAGAAYLKPPNKMQVLQADAVKQILPSEPLGDDSTVLVNYPCK